MRALRIDDRVPLPHQHATDLRCVHRAADMALCGHSVSGNAIGAKGAVDIAAVLPTSNLQSLKYVGTAVLPTARVSEAYRDKHCRLRANNPTHAHQTFLTYPQHFEE